MAVDTNQDTQLFNPNTQEATIPTQKDKPPRVPKKATNGTISTLAKNRVEKETKYQNDIVVQANALRKIEGWSKMFKTHNSTLTPEQKDMNKIITHSIELINSDGSLTPDQRAKKIEKIVLKEHLERDTLLDKNDRKNATNWKMYTLLRQKALQMSKMQEKIKENKNFAGVGSGSNHKNPMLKRMFGGKK